MRQTRETLEQNLAERGCWQVAQRDDSRVARRVSRKPVIDGVYRLDDGARLDDCFSFLHELGVIELLGDVQGRAVQRQMVPYVQDVLLYSLKTLLGSERRNALPALRFRDAALMRLGGVNAHQGRHGVCQRGAAPRQGPRTTGPSCPEAVAENLVQLHRRDLEAGCNGAIRALTRTGVWAAKSTGSVDATDLDTTAQYADCGHGTRQRQRTDTRGQVHEIEVTIYGWKLIVLIDSRPTIPLAGKVVPIHEPEGRSRRALVTQARTNVAGHARLHKVVVERGLLDGVNLWWLDQQGMTCVVPAKAHLAVTADARAQAAAGEGLTSGRRGHTSRQGQGRAARTERLATEVVGITGLTTDDP
jgi:hypothetical protein